MGLIESSEIFVPVVVHKKKPLLKRIGNRIEDTLTLGASQRIRRFHRAVDEQDVRVQPVQDLLAQEMFHKSYAELTIPQYRKVNARINWGAIQDFSRPLTLDEALEREKVI